MTTKYFNTPANAETLPLVKVILHELLDSLIYVGLVQTADTGQLDIDAIASLPGNATYRSGAIGYFVFRMNDTHQSATPIFIRFDIYRIQANGPSQSTIGIMVTVGSATDGAGNMVGDTRIFTNVTSASNASYGAAPAGVNFPSYFSCSEGFFGITWKVAAMTYGISGGTNTRGRATAAFISRTQDDSGDYTSDGFYTLGSDVSSGANASPFYSSYCYVGSYQTYIPYPGMLLGGGELFTSKGAVLVSKFYGFNPETKVFPGACMYYYSAISDGDIFECALGGSVNRHYIAMGKNTWPFEPRYGNATGCATAMLWE